MWIVLVMNPETKQQLPVVCRVCAEMAAIILWDIVGQPEISSRKEIEMFLDLLKGPKGDPVTQDILNKYLGIGTGCACDNRVFFCVR